jgi:hypothetical protein
MSLGTLFTLFVIPVAYTYIAGERNLAEVEGGGGTVSRSPASRA